MYLSHASFCFRFIFQILSFFASMYLSQTFMFLRFVVRVLLFLRGSYLPQMLQSRFFMPPVLLFFGGLYLPHTHLYAVVLFFLALSLLVAKHSLSIPFFALFDFLYLSHDFMFSRFMTLPLCHNNFTNYGIQVALWVNGKGPFPSSRHRVVTAAPTFAVLQLFILHTYPFTLLFCDNTLT
jgi:hypothetical protein